MGERRLGPAGSTLEAGGVVVHPTVGGIVGDERLGTVSTLLVVAGFKQRKQRGEQLPAGGLVGLSRRPSADRQHSRAGLTGERRPLDAGTDMDQRPSRSLVTLSVQLEPGVAGHDDVHLLLAGFRLDLLVLGDEPVAVSVGGHRVDAERGDPKVVTYRPKRGPPVTDLIDLIKPGNRESRHVSRPPCRSSSARAYPGAGAIRFWGLLRAVTAG